MRRHSRAREAQSKRARPAGAKATCRLKSGGSSDDAEASDLVGFARIMFAAIAGPGRLGILVPGRAIYSAVLVVFCFGNRQAELRRPH